jgi:hypothetical protein
MHAENISLELRALIIEDEILIAEELRDRLSWLGFSVIGAVDSADEGVAIATRERPELSPDGHPIEGLEGWHSGGMRDSKTGRPDYRLSLCLVRSTNRGSGQKDRARRLHSETIPST